MPDASWTPLPNLLALGLCFIPLKVNTFFWCKLRHREEQYEQVYDHQTTEHDRQGLSLVGENEVEVCHGVPCESRDLLATHNCC